MISLQTLSVFIAIVIIHWIADFVLQTEWQATNKSKNIRTLLAHVLVYSLVWFLLGTIWSISSNIYSNFTYLFDWWIVWKFTFITFICHFITDYFTSKLNTKLADKARETSEWHNFFVSVGFDQILHYVQLFVTFYLLT